MASLVTNARAKQHNLLNQVGTTLLGNLLEAASDWVKLYTRKDFTSAAYTEKYDGQGTFDMFLNQTPVTDVATVIIDYQDGTTPTTIDNTADDQFLYDGETGELKFHPNSTADITYFPFGFQNITVTYTAGYAALPEAITEAVCQIAAALYGMGSSSQNPAFESEKMGDYAYKLRNDLTKEGGLLNAVTRQTLNLYRTYGKAG